MTEKLKLWPGCYVELNNGAIRGPLETSVSKVFPWMVLHSNNWHDMWTENGEFRHMPGQDGEQNSIKRVLSLDEMNAHLRDKAKGREDLLREMGRLQGDGKSGLVKVEDAAIALKQAAAKLIGSVLDWQKLIHETTAPIYVLPSEAETKMRAALEKIAAGSAIKVPGHAGIRFPPLDGIEAQHLAQKTLDEIDPQIRLCEKAEGGQSDFEAYQRELMKKIAGTMGFTYEQLTAGHSSVLYSRVRHLLDMKPYIHAAITMHTDALKGKGRIHRRRPANGVGVDPKANRDEIAPEIQASETPDTPSDEIAKLCDVISAALPVSVPFDERPQTGQNNIRNIAKAVAGFYAPRITRLEEACEELRQRVRYFKATLNSTYEKLASLRESPCRPVEPAREIYRHKKRALYEVIGRGRMQVDGDLNHEKVVIYRALTGTGNTLWVRPAYEFEDGSFEPAESAPYSLANALKVLSEDDKLDEARLQAGVVGAVFSASLDCGVDTGTADPQAVTFPATGHPLSRITKSARKFLKAIAKENGMNLKGVAIINERTILFTMGIGPELAATDYQCKFSLPEGIRFPEIYDLPLS